MYTPAFLQEREAVEARILQAREVIAAQEAQLSAVDGELAALAGQRHRYELLTAVCDALDTLDEAGAGALFWGETEAAASHGRVERARGHAAKFLEEVTAIEGRRSLLLARIADQNLAIEEWSAELVELHEREFRRQSEFVVERDISDVPYRAMVMPWDPEGEDAKRFRKILFASLLVTFAIGAGLGLWRLPKEDKYRVIEVPERVVKMVQRKPPPPPPAAPRPPEEEKPEQVAEKPPEATPDEVKQARAKAESAGVLAFKNNFADLMGGAEPKLGADAQLGVDGRPNRGSRAIGSTTERSLLVAQASGGSGGIQVSTLSRGVGRAGDGGMEGVKIARMQDAIGSGDGGRVEERPLSRGPGPSRTDEEIQIVFDRYKAALYRIYNRELRNDPTLRGKMVLRLVIEPSGEVSSCKVESTDLRSPSLVAEISGRVAKFNFGPKENVARVTILYPIDFLPAN